MPARVAVRRLQIRGLAPRDHPAPGELEQRLISAARSFLPEALEHAVRGWSDRGVLRIRRLAVDITLDVAFDPEAFADLLAGAIAAALERTTEAERSPVDSDTVVVFASRAAYIAALCEALAAGRATQCWWLREAAEGLCFLSPAAAIRTALLAEPADGQAAILSLSPPRLASLLSALGAREGARVLDAFAFAAAAASSAAIGVEAAVAAIVAAAETAGAAAPEPLALYLRARAARATGGPTLAAVARLWVRLAAAVDRPYETDARAWLDWLAGDLAGPSGRPPDLAKGAPLTPPEASCVMPREADGLIVPEPARLALAASLARRRAGGIPAASPGGAVPLRRSPVLSRFAGLLLLVPGLDVDAIAARVADWPGAPPADTAALIAYASVGLCAGRQRFAAWLQESVWRELFGLSDRSTAAALAERLGGIGEPQWRTLAPLGLALDSPRNARFLLAPRILLGVPPGAWAPASVRVLAALAHALAARFGRRLNGLRAPSAPFLWENLLGAGGVLEPVEGGWQARLSRPPLDVLLSLSRLAEGSVRLPGGDVRVTRVAA
jgi:hypothetical protein